MISYISGAPDPVIFTYPDVKFHNQLDFTVGWGTGDPAIKGRVYRSLNGSAEVALASAPVSNGTAVEKISLDQVLTYILRRATNGQELARCSVTTQKNALAAYMTDPDHDFIFSLKVNPAIDTIAVSFQTKQPAVANVEIRRHDTGELVDSWMEQGFRQQHQRVFSGFGGGLPQDTAFDLRIVALKDIGGGRVSVGSGAHNPEIRGEVVTGARTVRFLFDLIYVRNDGDPSGPGEFTFTFGVGDVNTQKLLAPGKVWGEEEIPAGYDREVAKVFTINHAPRRMWAQVNAWEDDTFIFNPETMGFGAPAYGPGFDQPGSYGYENDYGSFASVTSHFDADEDVSGRQRGFIMSTGNFSIAYDVFGSMTVVRRNGTNNFPGIKLGRVRKPHATRAKSHSALLAAGRTRTIRTKLGYSTVSLGSDGTVILRTDDPRTGAGSVVDLGGRFDTSVTLVESQDDTLHVLGLTLSGEVVARSVTQKSTAEGVWLELGGKFTGALTGVDRDRFVDVLALDTEGRVSHRMLSPGGSDGGWRQIGSGVVSPVAATGTSAGDLAVFGLGVDGRILHKRLTAAGKWTPGSDEWDVLCRVEKRTAAEGIIAVHWETDEDLIVSVFVGDDLVGALLWHRYPEPDRDVAWMPVACTDRRHIA